MTPSDAVLLVEDTPSLSLVYETVLKKAGYPVTTAFTAAEAMAAHKAADGQVVLLDLMLPDGDGLDVLKEMTRADPSGKRIVITANGSINRAVEAMRGGAFDFLVKPFDERRLIAAVNNARAAIRIEAATPRARPATRADENAYQGFIGGSEPMRRIYEMIEGIGRSTATVFITGESGTGKEVAAQAIHDVSSRADGRFLPLNCGAIPKDLLESEVFGHLKGSFTGALADKPGAAAVADGGTLFLDEICEMDLALQTKLLRFLQTSMITPVGATTPRKVDVRIVCATNRDPADEVRAGRFREDLFYRLHVVPIHLPPLRERGDDVTQIAENFLVKFSQEEGKAFQSLGDEATELFQSMRWPGNVRQLQNVIRNIVVLNDGTEVAPYMLPQGLRESEAIAAPPQAFLTAESAPMNGHANGSSNLAARVAPLVGETLADVERMFIEATIEEFDGSIPQAARALDLSPSTLYRKREAWAKKATLRRLFSGGIQPSIAPCPDRWIIALFCALTFASGYSMSDDLILAAATAATKAYAPYSNYHVGAAIRGPSGVIYAGCNIENAAYPQGWCAEPTAISHMIVAGETQIDEVCVWADSVNVCSPCGGCRQKLVEFGRPGTVVISAGPDGERARWTLAELLPEAFTLEGET